MPDRNLADVFTAARNAYPRPVWIGNSTWKLMEYEINTNLLMLHELPVRERYWKQHTSYMISKSEIEQERKGA